MRKFILITLFLFSLGLYILTSIPTIYWEDSAELATTAVLLDIAHPPSYPLYNTLGKLFSFLPVNSFAFKINLMSAYFASFTVLLLFLIIYNLPGNLDRRLKIIISVFSSILFAFSHTFFQHAIKSEVYTLYTFFFSIIIFSLIMLESKKDIRFFYFAIFLFNLSLTNHLLIVFSLTALLFFVITYNYKVLFNIKNLSICLLFSAMAFSLYIYLPLRSAKEPKINWGNPQTIEGFKYIILLKEQGKLHQDFSKETEVKDREEQEKMIRERLLKKDMPREIKSISITGRSAYIFLIVFLPFYLAFAMLFKRDYGKYLKNKKFVVLSIVLICLFYLILSYSGNLLTMPVSIKISDLFDLLKREFSYKDMIKPTLDYIFILFLFLLSFTQKGRKKAVILSLIFTLFLTLFVYFALLGYVEYAKQHPVDFPADVYFDILLKQFTVFGFVLGMIGILKLLFYNLRIFIFFWFLFLSYTILPIMIIFPDNLPAIQERFSLPGYFVFSIFAGFGIKTIIEFGQKNIKLNYKYFYPVLIFSFIPLFLNFNQVNKNKYYLTKNYIDDIFLTLPKNSIILAKSIDTAFPLWYFNFVERKRSDVTVVFLDALTQKWYVDNLENYENLIIGKIEDELKDGPECRILYTENIIINNIEKRPIYYGGAPIFIPEGIKKGAVLPEGILFRITKTPQEKVTADNIEKNIRLLNSYKFTRYLSDIDASAKDILAIYAGGYYKLAVNYLLINKKYEATKELNKAIKIDPTFVPSYSTLSNIYMQKNDIKNAEKILKKGIKNNPKNIDLLFRLANLYFNIGNMEKSLKYVNRIIELHPTFIHAYFAKVDIFLALQQREKAKNILHEILKIDSSNQTAIRILEQLK